MTAHRMTVLAVLSLAALAAHVLHGWNARFDAAQSSHYGRELRAYLAGELALTAESMRVETGLVAHYDGLVDIQRALVHGLAELERPPTFLSAGERSGLVRNRQEAALAQRETRRRVEELKAEHAILRNSLRYLPVVARELDAYQPSEPAGSAQKEAASALVRDVLLLHTLHDSLHLERAQANLARLSRPESTSLPALIPVLVHARLVVEHAPRAAALLQQLGARPEVRSAELAVAHYDDLIARARERDALWLRTFYSLLFLTVLLFACAIVLHFRQVAGALRRTTEHLETAMDELRVEKEKQRELAELKSRFVAMTSHEFRTPLSTILSSNDLLEAYAPRWSEEKRREHFGRIRSSVKGMTRMLDGVLMVGRSDAGKLEFTPAQLDLRKLCAEAVETAALSCRGSHDILLDAPSGLDLTVVADEGLLHHVLDNLLSNAIKYSQPGSRVGVRLRRDEARVVLMVSDEGIGIPEEDRARLFDSFERGSNASAAPGTGLGLTIVKRAIDLHGGTLSLESTVGAGSCFIVRLPCAHTQPRESRGNANEDAA